MNLTMALRFFCALTVAGCATQGRLGALPTISDPKLAAEIIVIRDQRLAVHQSMMLDAHPGRRYYVRLQPILGSGTVPLPVAPPQELLTKTARAECGGTAWKRTPWRATQRAAWEAFRRADERE